MNCSCLSICQCDNLETLRVPDRRRSCTQLANFSVQAFTKYLFKKKKKNEEQGKSWEIPFPWGLEKPENVMMLPGTPGFQLSLPEGGSLIWGEKCSKAQA